MTKKIKPSEDSSLFEYEPHEDEVPEEETCALFYSMGTDPESLPDSDFKAKYLAYIEAQQKQ